MKLVLFTVLDPRRQACCSIVSNVLGAEKDIHLTAVVLVQTETSRAIDFQLSEHVTKISIFDPHIAFCYFRSYIWDAVSSSLSVLAVKLAR